MLDVVDRWRLLPRMASRRRKGTCSTRLETSNDWPGCGNTNRVRQTWDHQQEFYVISCKHVALPSSFYLLISEMVTLVCT